MLKKNNIAIGRALARFAARFSAGPRDAGGAGKIVFPACISRRRPWRTHAYRDSQVIFYGHDLPSEFRGRRR